MKGLAHRIVGIVMEARVAPKRVHARRHIPVPAAKPAKHCDVLISDLERRQRLRQRIAIILRVGAPSAALFAHRQER